MDLVRILFQHKTDIITVCGFLYSNITLVRLVLKRKQYVQKYREIEEKNIVSVEQALSIAKKSKRSQSYLIKAYPVIDKSKIIAKESIRSNQLMLIEPSLNRIVKSVINLLNTSQVQKDQKTSINKLKKQSIWHVQYWKVQNKSIQPYNSSQKLKKKPNSQSDFINVKGFGEVLDNSIFDVKWQYQQKKNRGFFSKIYQFFAYYTQLILFQTSSKANLPKQTRRPFISGPLVGEIILFFNFIKGRPILLQAQIQNQTFIALGIAGSKQNLLQGLKLKINDQNFNIGLLLAFSFCCLKVLQPSLSKIYRKIKYSLKKNIRKYQIGVKQPEKLNLKHSQLCEQNQCIICYSNCRNTVIFDCRHLIMCDTCKQVYKDQKCPLCKTEIKESKIFRKYK